MKLMIYIAKESFPTALGIICSNIGLMLNPTEVQMWISIASVIIGSITILVTIYTVIQKSRVLKKTEKKLDLEIDIAELEKQKLQKELNP
jgi:uncharacterized membrane protein (DUF106 family)